MRLEYSNSRSLVCRITIFTLFTANQLFAVTPANITPLAATVASGSSVARAAKPAEQAATLRTVVLAGDPAPVETGGSFSQIESASIADSGDVVFSARLSGASASSAILMQSGGETRVLLKAGDAAPGGGSFLKFKKVDVSRLTWMGKDQVFVLFNADLEGEVPEGLFLWTPDSIEPIALAGGKTARGQTYVSFEQLFIIAVPTTEGPGFSLAFVAGVSSGQKAAIFRDSTSPHEQNLSTGDTISAIAPNDPLDRIDNLEISPIGAFTVACLLDVHRVNKPGKAYRRVIAFGHVMFWVGNWHEGGKLRGIGKIKRILDSPSISSQSVFATVELKQGRRALTGFGITLVESKRRAPGLPGRTIRDIGPPISNAAFPVLAFGQRPGFGIASKVLLDGDTEALWVLDGTLDGNKARVELLGGVAGGISIRGFSPRRLTNFGSLLLTGTISDASDRAGLFVLEGLFRQLQD